MRMRRRSLHTKQAAKYAVKLKRCGRQWIVQIWDDWFQIYLDSEPMSREDALKLQEEHRQKVINREEEGRGW